MARPKEFDVDQALASAMEAFWERGYEATSLCDLTEAMGVQRASLYATYGDKHRLFLAALELYARRERESLETSLRAPSPVGAIRSIFAAATACPSVKASRRGCFLVNAAAEVGPHDARATAILKGHVDRVEELLAGAIARGQRTGEMRRGVPPVPAARMLLNSLYGIAVLKKIDPAHPRLADAATTALRLLEA